MNPGSDSLHDRVLRKNDFGALFALFFGVLFVARADMLEMTKETGPMQIAFAGLGFVFVVLLPTILRGIFRKAPPGEDEYLRKLLAMSAASGFYLAFAVFVVWTPLTGSLLPALTAAQVLGLMLVGAGIAWCAMRWRDAH